MAARELIYQALKETKKERDAAFKDKATPPPGGLVTAVANLEEALHWYDVEAKEAKKKGN